MTLVLQRMYRYRSPILLVRSHGRLPGKPTRCNSPQPRPDENHLCQIANQISQGQIDIGIGCGVEHMSTGQDNPTLASKMSEDVLKGQEVKDVLLPMGTTSENVSIAL